jgi:competence protein ComEA
MFRKILREWVMLPRSEQRALVLLSFLLVLSLAARMVVGHLLPGEPDDLESFLRDAQRISETLSGMDQPPQVNLNRADSSDLLPLPGIGPVFAARIIKYRELLGGYVSLDQLREVYGLSAETVEMLKGRVLIEPSLVRKINLNRITFRELLRHPYIQMEEVKRLMAYRDRTGSIESPEVITTNGLLADSTLRKIGPYLDWEP